MTAPKDDLSSEDAAIESVIDCLAALDVNTEGLLLYMLVSCGRASNEGVEMYVLDRIMYIVYTTIFLLLHFIVNEYPL